jgi:hypothetical protein
VFKLQYHQKTQNETKTAGTTVVKVIVAIETSYFQSIKTALFS